MLHLISLGWHTKQNISHIMYIARCLVGDTHKIMVLQTRAYKGDKLWLTYSACNIYTYIHLIVYKYAVILENLI